MKLSTKSELIQSPCGCTLTIEQAATIRGKLNAALRTSHGGPPRTCECGECAKCKRRLKRNSANV